MPHFTVQMGVTDHFEIIVEAKDYIEAQDIATYIDIADWTLRDSNTEYFDVSQWVGE